MEIPSLQQGFERERGLQTMEKPLTEDDEHEALRIGVPREVGNEEQRVALAPSGAGALVADGHEVYVEEGAGHEAHFQNDEYADAGAELVTDPDDLYGHSDLIVKVGPPVEDEMDLLQDGQILLSALNLGGTTPEFLHHLMRLKITAIGFEFIRDPDGTFPLVRMMHEITGSMAIQIAGRYLESTEGGKGVMLGGISGVPPATVVILGADVVIGAMMAGGERSPLLITEDMVQSMSPGGVIVDAVMDQGGCVETSRPTTHSDPVYRRHDVIHYCVPNMPSNAARTATYALSHVLVPYLLRIGESGSINEALWHDEGLRNGTYVYRKHLTKQSLATMFGMSHRDIELLIASGI